MRSKQLHLITAALVCFIFFGCNRTIEEFQSEPLSDYFPLQVGKYITYRLDSTVFTNFGTVVSVRSFQEKHIVDAKITDALGRDSYRILRFTRDTAGTQSWTPAGTYLITPTNKTIEVIENNLRVIKLALPIRQGFSWKGNEFLPSRPFNNLYSFNNDIGMENWDYTIDSVNTIFRLSNFIFNNVIRVTDINDVSVVDTLTVNNNLVQIPDTLKSIYLRGNASQPITITALPPKTLGLLTIYNRTNMPAKLGTIDIPVNGGKRFEYLNNNWTYGYVDAYGARKDTVIFELPYGYKTVLVDRYAKNVGLISQLFIMWEYEYDLARNTDHRVGFEMRRTIVDHN